MGAYSEYGLVIRRRALQERGVTEAALAVAMDRMTPRTATPDLYYFAPLFGEEAQYELGRHLTALGLVWVDDFWSVSFDMPDWVKVTIGFA